MNNCNLSIYQGDDWAGWVTVLNVADGTPANLTGYTAQAQIRTGPADLSIVIVAEMLVTVVTPNNLSLYLTNAQTLSLQSLFYCWDLQLITPAGMVVTLMAGDVNVTAEVTRESASLPQPQGVLLWAVPTLPLPWPRVYPYPALPGRLVRRGL